MIPYTDILACEVYNWLILHLTHCLWKINTVNYNRKKKQQKPWMKNISKINDKMCQMTHELTTESTAIEKMFCKFDGRSYMRFLLANDVYKSTVF